MDGSISLFARPSTAFMSSPPSITDFLAHLPSGDLSSRLDAFLSEFAASNAALAAEQANDPTAGVIDVDLQEVDGSLGLLTAVGDRPDDAGQISMTLALGVLEEQTADEAAHKPAKPLIEEL
jgi:hypothetical protein